MSFNYKVRKISKIKNCYLITSSSFFQIREEKYATIFNKEMQNKIIKKNLIIVMTKLCQES